MDGYDERQRNVGVGNALAGSGSVRWTDAVALDAEALRREADPAHAAVAEVMGGRGRIRLNHHDLVRRRDDLVHVGAATVRLVLEGFLLGGDVDALANAGAGRDPEAL